MSRNEGGGCASARSGAASAVSAALGGRNEGGGSRLRSGHRIRIQARPQRASRNEGGGSRLCSAVSIISPPPEISTRRNEGGGWRLRSGGDMVAQVMEAHLAAMKAEARASARPES